MKEEARTTLRIDPELFTEMKKRAEHLGITLNQYVERLARIDLEKFDQGCRYRSGPSCRQPPPHENEFIGISLNNLPSNECPSLT